MGWFRSESDSEPRRTVIRGITMEEHERRVSDIRIEGESIKTLEARLRATIEDAKRAKRELDNSIAASHRAARQRGGR